MKKKKLIFAIFLAWTLCPSAHGSTQTVQIPTREMLLGEFLHEASQTLNISIEASSVGDALKQKVHFKGMGLVTRPNALNRIESALEHYNLTLVYDSVTDIYRLQLQREGRDSALPIYVKPDQLPKSNGLITYLFTLSHLEPESFARILRTFAPVHSRIVSDDLSHAVMITDRVPSIRKYIGIAGSIDVPDVAEDYSQILRDLSKRREQECSIRSPSSIRPEVLYALIAAVALMMGFGLRGYLIRRIEGGL